MEWQSWNFASQYVLLHLTEFSDWNSFLNLCHLLSIKAYQFPSVLENLFVATNIQNSVTREDSMKQSLAHRQWDLAQLPDIPVNQQHLQTQLCWEKHDAWPAADHLPAHGKRYLSAAITSTILLLAVKNKNTFKIQILPDVEE